MNLIHTGDLRQSTLLYNLTRHLIFNQWRDANEEPKLHLFGQLKAITRQWLDEYLECTEGTFPAQLMYQDLADQACERITHGIFAAGSEGHEIHALLDPYNSQGSTRHVNFTTSRQLRWETDSRRCHVNWAILDSGWEAEFCRVAEKHPQVRAYVKNHSLGFEVPYKHMAETRKYRPDFIVLVEDGHGEDDLLRLVVEIKGYRREDAKDKKLYMENYWVPGVNRRHRPDGQGGFGRWAFAEFCDVETMSTDFEEEVASHFDRMIDDTLSSQPSPQES
jgi:type III restriction enzyme